MKKKIIFGIALLFLTTTACTLFDEDNQQESDEVVKMEQTFLWQRMGDEKYVDFMASFRCVGNDEDGYSDKQLDLLKDNDIDLEKYKLENDRPDWFTEYAETGLEEKIRVKMNDICS